MKLILALSLAGVHLTQLSAATIFNSLPGTNPSWGTISGAFARSFGVGFTLPAGSSYNVDSATLGLTVNDATATFQLELYGSDGLGAPIGPMLGSFNVPGALATGTGNYVFTPNAAIVLNPSSTYWLVAGRTTADAGDGVLWLTGGTVTGLATFAGDTYNNPAVFPPTGAGINSPPALQIDGSAINSIPEPSGFALVVLGCVALGIRVRRT